MTANHFGIRNCLPIITKIAYTRHIRKFIKMAENPSVMITFLKYGIVSTTPLACDTGFFASILLKIIKSKKAILQMMVNLEKNKITFIGVNLFL